jgi:hypothetical protein
MADYEKEWEKHSVRSISLRVASIVAYGHELSEMDPGLTGRVVLDGIGAELLRDGDVLSEKGRVAS